MHDGDGRGIPVEVRVDPILSEHGALEGTSIIVQDLREQRALDEAKRQLRNSASCRRRSSRAWA